MGKELIKCERCGKTIREKDSFVDEDSHDILCDECYYGDREEVTDE